MYVLYIKSIETLSILTLKPLYFQVQILSLGSRWEEEEISEIKQNYTD